MKAVVFNLCFAAAAALPATVPGAPVEVLREGGVKVSFEKTGDFGQIEAFRKSILPAVKEILSALNSDLGAGSGATEAEVYFYSPQTYHAKFPGTAEANVPAFFRAGEVHARADNDVNHALLRTLRHELTHLLIDKNYGGAVPTWLNEGLAEYQERRITVDPEPNSIDYNTLVIARQDGTFLPLSRLEASSLFLRSEGTVMSRLAYTTAFVAVSELIRRHGMSAVRGLLEAAKEGRSVAGEFERRIGMSYGRFEEELILKAREQS